MQAIRPMVEVAEHDDDGGKADDCADGFRVHSWLFCPFPRARDGKGRVESEQFRARGIEVDSPKCRDSILNRSFDGAPICGHPDALVSRARYGSPFRDHCRLVNGDHGNRFLRRDLPELPDAVVTDGETSEVTLACCFTAVECAEVCGVREG